MKLDSYIHLTTLELPIKIDCGGYFICSRQLLSIDIFYHRVYKCIAISMPHLQLFSLSDSLEYLLSEMKYDIKMLWRIYVQEDRESTSDEKELSKNLQEAFFEMDKENWPS